MQYFISKARGLFAITVLTASFAVSAGETHIPEQLLDNPPTEHSGLAVSGRDTLKLGEQIPALEGYQVRVRTVTMEPGGVVKNHAHESRPGAFYIAEGEVTEIRGDQRKKIKSGQTVIEDHDTEHWVINDGKKEAVIFVFDIVPVE